MSNDVIFSETDPLGNKVILDSTAWKKHIVRGHPELENKEQLVKSTIQNPETIYKDKDFSDRRCYRTKHKDSTLEPYGKYIKVVVASSNPSDKVITAFLTSTSNELTYKIYP